MRESAGRQELRSCARSFVRAAFRHLRQERVIPTPNYHPFIRVGRDYFGVGIMGSEYHLLEALLEREYPQKFAEPLTRKDPEFASAYIFALLEGCVRRCAGPDGVGPARFSADSPEVTISIHEMMAGLEREGTDIVVASAISHATTATGAPMRIGIIDIIPSDSDHPSSRFLSRTLRDLIPGAGQAYNREMPDISLMGRPYCILATSGHSHSSPFDETAEMSGRLSRFLLAMRLLTGTTARTHFELQGPPELVAPWHPHLVNYHPIVWPLVRRKLVLDSSHGAAVDGLGQLLNSTGVKREGMATTSLDIAIARYSASFDSDGVSSLIDLCTAMEAVLIDEADGTEGLSSRLRTRAAALLATDTDSAASIFGDVKRLYDLRSRIVHGANLTEKRLRETVLQVSTLTEHRAFGVAVAQAVDRMRDLTRRSILARVCLSLDGTPSWPFRPTRSMDVLFADRDMSRHLFMAWRETLARIGANDAFASLPAAADILREDYDPERSLSGSDAEG